MTSTRDRLASTSFEYYALARLRDGGIGDPDRLPITVKILLEGLLREADAGRADEVSVRALTRWPEAPSKGAQLPFLPSRILLQDFTGVPAGGRLAAVPAAMGPAGD